MTAARKPVKVPKATKAIIAQANLYYVCAGLFFGFGAGTAIYTVINQNVTGGWVVLVVISFLISLMFQHIASWVSSQVK